MQITVRGSTGSIPSPGVGHLRYGGNTSCVEVVAADGSQIVLDAGSGIRALGQEISVDRPIHVVFSHLHVDHVMGLGFFRPLYLPGCEVHLWGPSGRSGSFRHQLDSFFAHPLFPVRLDEVACDLKVHDLPVDTFELPGFSVTTAQVSHPGPTRGIRVEGGGRALAYLPDHEPGRRHHGTDDRAALELCAGATLVHDVMYHDEDFVAKVGFGHSSVSLAADFIDQIDGTEAVLPFHFEPSYGDARRESLCVDFGRLVDGIRRLDAAEGATHSL